MKAWIMKTAWPMTTPLPYSPFHICFALFGALLALWAARTLSRGMDHAGRRGASGRFARGTDHAGRRGSSGRFAHGTEHADRRGSSGRFARGTEHADRRGASGRGLDCEAAYFILFGCGVLLGVSEIYKQLFLYYVVNGGSYDWWYFPFQLCSLPMYFCLLLPLIHSGKARLTLCTFMQDFHLLGGIMALAEPSGLLHPYWTLTLHGFIWHIVLIFISLFIGLGHLSDLSLSGFVRTIPIFGICCLIASVINVCAPPRGQADMFYISPYYPSNQILYHEISLKTGIFAGNLIYLLSICLGGLICHLLFSLFMKKYRAEAD